MIVYSYLDYFYTILLISAPNIPIIVYFSHTSDWVVDMIASGPSH